MKIFVKSAKLKFFSKEEGKFFNFSPTIRRIKNIETEIGFLETDSERLINELKANELFLFVEGEETKEVKVVEGEETKEVEVEETPKVDTPVAPKNKPIKK